MPVRRVPTMDQLLELCVTEGASDIHITVGSPPVLRVNTRLVAVEDLDPLLPEDTDQFMKSVVPEPLRAYYTENGAVDCSLQYQDKARFRVSAFKQKGHCSLVLRRIPSKILRIDQIGLPHAVLEICDRSRGLFLVTGPTGSGKTTTLASLINHINENSDKHILTFEDPIEYYHVHKKSLVNQREIGVDVPNFPSALRSGLRQDPDVILVGEMRDLETMRAAVSAAETGHLVFATLHTQGAAASVNRIIDAFPTDEKEQIRVQLAGSLCAVLSQTLCPRIDRAGMVAAYEFLHVNSAVQAMIRDDRPFQIDSTIQTGARKFGMQLLDNHLQELVRARVISSETAIERARDIRAMRDWVANPT